MAVVWAELVLRLVPPTMGEGLGPLHYPLPALNSRSTPGLLVSEEPHASLPADTPACRQAGMQCVAGGGGAENF